jgi:hypothetical protein
MARPQVADGADDLKIWRIAANIRNKHFGAAEKRRFFRVRRGANKSIQ